MDNILINLQYSIKVLAIEVNVTGYSATPLWNLSQNSNVSSHLSVHHLSLTLKIMDTYVPEAQSLLRELLSPE